MSAPAKQPPDIAKQPPKAAKQQPNMPAWSGVEINPRLVLIAVLSGAVTGLVGGLLMKLLRAIQTLGYHYQSNGSFLDAVEKSSPERRLVCLLVAAAVVAVAIWAKRGLRIGDAGVTEAVWQGDGSMSLRATSIESVASIIVVGLGVSLGRETALKEAGGVVGSRIGTWFKLSNVERRVLVSITAGAGMAVAYNLPFGGALLAAEVFLGTLSLPILLLALIASGVGTAVSWLLLPAEATYLTPLYQLDIHDVLWALLAAPVFGLLAHAWIRAIAWARTHRPRGYWRYIVPVFVFGALGIAARWFPQLLGNGKSLVAVSLEATPWLHLSLALLVLKFVFTAACVETGTPGGLFTPTMSLGGLCGGILGRFSAWIAPGIGLGRSPESCALVGAAAVLAVATQGPLSALVMVMELTRHAEPLMVPMVIATAGAAWTAQRLAGQNWQSIYTI